MQLGTRTYCVKYSGERVGLTLRRLINDSFHHPGRVLFVPPLQSAEVVLDGFVPAKTKLELDRELTESERKDESVLSSKLGSGRVFRGLSWHLLLKRCSIHGRPQSFLVGAD
jgi:hypothetical protein